VLCTRHNTSTVDFFGVVVYALVSNTHSHTRCDRIFDVAHGFAEVTELVLLRLLQFCQQFLLY